MRRARFFAPPGAFSSDLLHVELDSDEARHLRDVLRGSAGDEVTVFDGTGREFAGRIQEIKRDRAKLEILSQIQPAKPESPLHLTLAVALLKGDKFDLVVQKATELGVTQIIPVTTTRADIRLRDQTDASKRVTRWRRIAIEAAKQSGRAQVPEILAPQNFQSIIDLANDRDTKIVMFSERDGTPLNQLARELAGHRIVAVIGSEGGWTDEELVVAQRAGVTPVTLGGRILRAETAAIAVTVLLQHLFGDLR